MMTTKFEDNEVKISMNDALKKSIVQYGFNHLELYRLLQSFSHKLLEPREEGVVSLENEDTGARLEVEIKWPAEKEATLTIISVDMQNLQRENLTGRPKGASFDFNPPPEQ